MNKVVWIVGGSLLGFGIGAVLDLTLNPVLEASTSWVRELQGMLWNLVPALTAAGLALGWAGAGRSQRSKKETRQTKPPPTR